MVTKKACLYILSNKDKVGLYLHHSRSAASADISGVVLCISNPKLGQVQQYCISCSKIQNLKFLFFSSAVVQVDMRVDECFSCLICFGGVDSQGTSSLLIFQLLEQTNNVLYATVIVLVSVLKISRQHS